MATSEKTGILTYVDEAGTLYLLYPVTQIDAVDGLQEELDKKMESIEDGSVTANKLAAGAVRLTFENVSVAASAFADDTTYADFPFRASIALEGALASMHPEVVFGVAEAMSGNYAPVAESHDGGVYIYTAEMPEATVTIPTIVLWR